MITRRSLVAGSAGMASLASPLGARAAPDSFRSIRILMAIADSPDGQSRISAFRESLQGLGWADGRNVRIEVRWAGGNAERMRAYSARVNQCSRLPEGLASVGRTIWTIDRAMQGPGSSHLQKKLPTADAAREERGVVIAHLSTDVISLGASPRTSRKCNFRNRLCSSIHTFIRVPHLAQSRVSAWEREGKICASQFCSLE